MEPQSTARESAILLAVDVPRRRVDEAILRSTRRVFTPALAAAAVYYTLVSVSLGVFGHMEHSQVLLGFSGALAAFYGVLALAFRSRLPPKAWTWPLVGLAASLALTNVVAFHLLAGDDRAISGYLLLAVVIGSLVLHGQLLVGLLLFLALGWAGVTALHGSFGPDTLLEAGYLFGTEVLAVLLHRSWVSTIAAQESLRLQTELRQQELEEQLLAVRQAEAALQRSQQGLKELVEHNPDGIVIVRQGVVLFANPTFCRLVKREGEQLVNQRLVTFVAPEDQHRARTTLFETGRTEGLPVSFLLPDQQRIMLDLLPAPVQFRGGPAMLLMARDASAQRQELGDRVMLADRMQVVSTLAAGVAHELGNPLAALVAHLELMRTLAAEGPVRDLEPRIDRLFEQTSRMQLVLDDLRTFSKSDGDKDLAVELPELVRRALRLMAGQWPEGCVPELQLADVPRIRAPAPRMTQVILNVLRNAAQACTARPGRVIVRCERSRAGHVVLEVIDKGPGMSEAVRRRAFEPFFTTRSVGDGVGLGLTYAHNVVRQLGGDILIESTEGVGTTVRLVLQALPDEALPTQVPTLPPAAPGTSPALRVLVIDDEPEICEVIAALLFDHRVTTCSAAPEARPLLEQRWDVILCDLRMPVLSGRELFEQAPPHAAARFVFLTGGATDPESQRFLDQGVRPVIEKPFTAARLRKALEKVGRAPADEVPTAS